MSQLPSPGSDFKEEEEEHEEEAGADVQDHTQAHVHTVKTQAQDPHPPPCSPFRHLPLMGLVSGSRFWLLLLWSAGLCRVCGELWRSQGV